MNAPLRLAVRVYSFLLAFYPEGFRADFGEEMQLVFSTAVEEAHHQGVRQLLGFLGRELRDWPGSVWRAHRHSGKGVGRMTQGNYGWRPLNSRELGAGLLIFVFPMFPPILKLIFGYQYIINTISSIFFLLLLAIVLVLLFLGIKNGFPRWTLPYLGAAVTGIVFFELSYRVWGLFAADVQRFVKYYTKTLAARIQYSALLHGFFWFLAFTVLVLLILLLRLWPRTRPLAQRIRQDWTLLSFMLYSALVLNLELIFEEYAYDEAWKIACRIFLALGAWVYFKSADSRKRILALLVGCTLTFGIAAAGKWTVLELQSWGGWYGYDHWTYRRFELGSTISQWVWVMIFMLIPALLRFMPGNRTAISNIDEDVAHAG